MRKRSSRICGVQTLGTTLAGLAAGLAAGMSPCLAQAPGGYQIYVTNEKSGDVTVIGGAGNKVLATIPLGKRPRGIHASPDGRTIYVALTGTPIAGPPSDRKAATDAEGPKADKSADAIGVIDVATRRLTRKISAGSDPEEFSLSADGTKLYVSNEDVKTASVIDIASGKVEHVVAVGEEPEGVATTPDGKRFYVTCEAGGEINVVDTARYGVIGHFNVNERPRSVAFLPGSPVAFIPSELTGELNVIDTTNLKVSKVVALPQGSRPMSVKVSLDGKRIYVSNGRAGTVSVLDSRTYDLVSTIQVGSRPWGLALSPDGALLYAANGPSNDVSVVDLKTNKEIARIGAGMGPWSVAVVPATD